MYFKRASWYEKLIWGISLFEVCMKHFESLFYARSIGKHVFRRVTYYKEEGEEVNRTYIATQNQKVVFLLSHLWPACVSFAVNLFGKLEEEKRNGDTQDNNEVWWDQLCITFLSSFLKGFSVRITCLAVELVHLLSPYGTLFCYLFSVTVL